MRTAVLLLALFGLTLAAEIETEENVLVLTNDNFQQALDDNQYLLVEFYAPWCGHCKALAPQYAAAATALAEENSEIKLGKVDATEEGELAQNFGVQGYPTIKFFKSGNPMDYSGGRTSDEILLWLKKKTGPPADALLTTEDANAFIEKNEVAVIGFFEEADSEAAKAFTAAADSEDTLSFGITTSKEVAEALETTLDSIVLFKKFDDGRVVFSGDYTEEDILDFVHGEQMPLLTTFSDETAPQIFGGTITTHLLAFYSSESEDAETLGTTLRTVAAEVKGKILFVHIDMAREESDRITEFFGITEDNVPTTRIITMGQDMKKFVPEFSELTADNIRAWVQDFLDGKLEAHRNSEEIPDNWDEENVKVLVGKNFQEVALDATKDVFVEFYAPWCGHCKQLAPIWEQLAEHFKDDENVVIAQMDSTKNEVEEVTVQGFPTLKFFRRETNEVVDYNGGRTLDDLTKWVEAQVAGKGDEEEEDEEEEEGEEGEEPEDEAVPSMEIEGEENVLVLTKENFQQTVDENQYLLVEFYAPWCGHCKVLAPQYAAAATALAEENSEIKLAKVDATEEGELAEKFEARGFPTLKFFRSGKPIQYNGGRTSEEILLWLKKKTGPPADALPTTEDANAFIEKNEVAVIGFFEEAESEAAKAFTAAAYSVDTSFGITTSKEVAEALGTTLDSIMLFKKFDEGRVVFSGDFTEGDILTFVRAEHLPLLNKFSAETSHQLLGGPVLLAFYSSEAEDAETLGTTLRTVAAEVKGKVLFLHFDMSQEESKQMLEFFLVTDDSVPTARIFTMGQDMKKFVPEFSELTAVNIRAWVQDFLNGKLKAHRNSEEIPDNWDEEDVKVLVGKNFQAVALDATKDVFVDFYAPGCGHCRQLAPIWEQLAEYFKDDESVVIAEVDSTKNEVEEVTVMGFPTLKFFRRGTNEIVDYDGGRTLDELIKFVEGHKDGKSDEGEEEEEGGEEPEEEAVPIEGEENVLVLTKENFQQTIEENHYILVEFYAPWCHYCKDLAPHYAAAATKLAEENSEIKLAKVDATEETELGKKYAKGYPTLKFFKSGNPMEYNGGRTSDDILLWLKKKTGPPADALPTTEDANAFIEKNEVAVIGFFEEAESEAAKAFTAAAYTMDLLAFGITTSKEVAEALGTTLDSIVLFKQFDEGRAVFSGDYTTEDIQSFVQREQMALLTKYSDNASMKIFRGPITTYLMAAYSSEAEGAETLGTTLRTVAAEFKGKVLFVHIDMSQEESKSVAGFFQITEDDAPTARILTMGQGQEQKTFVPEFSELTADNIRTWVQDFLDGKLKPHLNSEEIPANWDEEDLKVLVGKNFQEVALDATKDVFVEFYAPWCGHCKQLAPIWEQLAEHFKDDENIVIAQIDATKNEVEEVTVQGFPTLKFFRRETNEIVDYNGGHTLDKLVKFVEGHKDGRSDEGEEEEGGEEPEEEAVPIEGEENVLVLTEENFQQTIEENQYILVEFYAPWCGHCKALAPQYAAAATALAEENSEIKLAKVDATEERELAEMFEVQGFPTLRFFRSGNPIDYSGGRTSDEILLWLKKKTGPPADTLPTTEDANAFVEKNEVAVIGFFEEAESEAAKAFTAAAYSMDTSFGITTSKEVAEALETTLDSIVLFKKFDEGRAVFSGDYTTEDILTFVQREQTPLLSKYSVETAAKIFGGTLDAFLVAFYSSESEDAETLGTTLRTVAAEVKGKVPFVHVDMSQEESKRMAEFFGITDGDVPAVRMVNLAQGTQKFVPKFPELTADNIRSFIQEYLDGKLKPHFNSEEIPANWDEEDLKVLVGKTFQEVALDTTKDVFVEFHSPSCPHCVDLAPTWEQLAEHFKDDENVVIAQIDATKNEFEDFTVNAFPTLKFFRRETNEIVEYKGGRTLDELVKWVEGHKDGKSDEGEEEEEEEEGWEEPEEEAGPEHTEL